MTDPTPGTEGSGAQRTYLVGEVASASVDADLHLHTFAPPPDQLKIPKINITGYTFQTEDYLVLDGVPTGNAPLQCKMTTRLGLGAWTYTEAPPAPGELNIGATARWLPTPDTFLEGEGWTPYTGAGFSLTTDPVSTPYLDSSYSFQTRGGDEVGLPAVVLSGDAWLAADDLGWTAQAFTFGLVAVLHANSEGPNYGIVESASGVDGDPYVDWGVRYLNGSVALFAGTKVVSHPVVRPQARPVVILVAMDATEGRLLVADRNKSTRSFATDRMQIYDAQIYLGRMGSHYSADTTAAMDVLEFAYWDHGLTFAEMANVLHDWDSVYGIVG